MTQAKAPKVVIVAGPPLVGKTQYIRDNYAQLSCLRRSFNKPKKVVTQDLLSVKMNNCILICLFILLLTSCGSSEELGVANFNLGKDTISVSLRSESLFNPDGLIKRVISLELPNQDNQEFGIHNAHYSDMVYLKKLEVAGNTYLIAEDKTGYTVWDFNKKKVIAEDDMDDNEMAEDPSGTARDYMTHKPLNKKQWVKVIGAGPAKNVNVVEISWQ